MCGTGSPVFPLVTSLPVLDARKRIEVEEPGRRGHSAARQSQTICWYDLPLPQVLESQVLRTSVRNARQD